MEFSPFNNVVKLCLQGMSMEEKGLIEDAAKRFIQAWDESTNDFERYLSAYYISRVQQNVNDKLHWLTTSLKYAFQVNDNTVKSAFSSIYLDISRCYHALNNFIKEKEFSDLANSYQYQLFDNGPFYHGTRAHLQIGGILTPGNKSNYKEGLIMNHIYFTASIKGAGLAAELAKGDSEPRVYLVEPIGKFENDPNVTDKKFPGNPTRSYRSTEPLKVVDEIVNWERLSAHDLENWKKKLNKGDGDIIN